MPVFSNILAGASGQGDDGFKINRSLRFDHTNGGSYLDRTASLGNQQKWAWTGWVKEGGSSNTNMLFVAGSSDENAIYINLHGNIIISRYSGSFSYFVQTARNYRDHTGWLHIAVNYNSAAATDTDRVKLFVNGLRVTEFSGTTWPSQHSGYEINTAVTHKVGRYLDGYLAEVHILDGLNIPTTTDNGDGAVTGFANAEYITEFGEFNEDTSVWVPKDYEGNYNGSAVAGTSFANAGGGTPLYNTTNDGQTLGSGYTSGATSNSVLLIPGFNTSEEPTSNSISNQNSVRTTSNAKWYGTALEFSRSAASQNSNEVRYFNFNNDLNLSGRSNYCIEAWVYPRSGSNGYNIMFQGDWNNNNGLLFNMNSNGRLEHHLGDGSFQSFYSNLSAPMDTWSHVAVVCHNNTIKFFLNGSMYTAGTRTKNYSNGNNHKVVGAYVDSNHGGSPRNGFYGYMQDIRVSHVARYTAAFSIPGSGQQNAGTNGLHLDFADNQNDTALGLDAVGNKNFTVYNLVATQPGNGSYIPDLSNVTNGGDYTGRYRSAFDGNLATESYGFNNDTITWTPTGGKAYTSARVYGRGESGNNHGLKYKLGGGTETTITVTTSGAWYTLPANGTIEYISWNRPGASNVTTFVSAIEINGTVLVDNTAVRDHEIDSVTDSPTNYLGAATGGNYAVLNPEDTGGAQNLIPTNGNLQVAGAGNNSHIRSTIPITSGKYYWEWTHLGSGTGDYHLGVSTHVSATDMGTDYVGANAKTWGLHPSPSGSSFWRHNGNTNLYTFASFNQYDVGMMAVDADSGKIYVGKNGTWFGTNANPAAGTGAASTNLPTDGTPIFPTFMPYDGTGIAVNFGAAGFKHNPPSGFKALVSTNMGTPSVKNPQEHFYPKLYTGSNAQQSQALKFSPDWIWLKNRSHADGWSQIRDIVRGGDKNLTSNGNNAENAVSHKAVTFDSSGFTLTGSSGSRDDNYSGDSYVAWCWDMGESTVTNNDGNVASTVRANTTCGLSIVSWANGNNTNPASRKIGHGLGQVPDAVLVKSRTSSNGGWNIRSEVFNNPVRDELYLASNVSVATAGVDLYYRDSTTFGFRETSIGGNGDNMIAYAIKSIPGFSKVGMFTGNGGNFYDAPHVWLGFRPNYLMMKNYSSGGANQDWIIVDGSRPGYNPTALYLLANSSNAEANNSNIVDFLSTGFRVRAADSTFNGNGNSIFYIAFAAAPAQFARAF